MAGRSILGSFFISKSKRCGTHQSFRITSIATKFNSTKVSTPLLHSFSIILLLLVPASLRRSSLSTVTSS